MINQNDASSDILFGLQQGRQKTGDRSDNLTLSLPIHNCFCLLTGRKSDIHMKF